MGAGAEIEARGPDSTGSPETHHRHHSRAMAVVEYGVGGLRRGGLEIYWGLRLEMDISKRAFTHPTFWGLLTNLFPPLEL